MRGPSPADKIRDVNRSLIMFFAFVGLVTVLLYLAFVTSFASGQEIAQRGDETTASSPTFAGTWRFQDSGSHAELVSAGDSIVGRTDDVQPRAIRGAWLQDHLVLILNHAAGNAGACDRSTFVASTEGDVRLLSGKWLNDQGIDELSRISGPGTGPLGYPYEEELRACGDLVVYELPFQKGSDVLQGREWPILSALTGLLKKDPSLKIRITGHTDPSGDPSTDNRLSLGRAEAVKEKLVQKFGVNPARILTEGAGSEQPIDDNATELGRVANRRIEIVSEQACARTVEDLVAESDGAESTLVVTDVVDVKASIQTTSAQSGCGAQGPLQVVAEYARLRTKEDILANRTE